MTTERAVKGTVRFTEDLESSLNRANDTNTIFASSKSGACHSTSAMRSNGSSSSSNNSYSNSHHPHSGSGDASRSTTTTTTTKLSNGSAIHAEMSSLRAVAPTALSKSALSTRKVTSFTSDTPMSPGSPASGAGSPLTTSVSVQPLYRIPAHYYGSASTAAAVLHHHGGQARAHTHAPSSAAAATWTSASRADEAVNGVNNGERVRTSQGHVGTNASRPLPFSSSSSPSSTTSCCCFSALEERARRAAQLFESGAASCSLACDSSGKSSRSGLSTTVNAEVAAARVLVARGYRPLSSVPRGASADDVSATAYTLMGSNSSSSSGTGSRIRRTALSGLQIEDTEGRGEKADDTAFSDVVPLFLGTKRSRGGSSTQVFLPAGVLSPSVTTPFPQTSATAASAAADPALMRKDSSTTLSVATTTTTTGALRSVAAAALTAPATPFHALLSAFTERPQAHPLSTLRATTKEKNSAACVASMGGGPTGEEPPWLTVLTSHVLSHHLAAQVERDADAIAMMTTMTSSLSSEAAEARLPSRTAAPTVARSEGRASKGVHANLRATSALLGNAHDAGLVSDVATTTSVLAPSPTLYDALLCLFDLVEQLELEVAKAFAPTAASSKERGLPSSPAIAAAAVFPSSCPPPGVRDAFLAVTRHWSEVLLARWPSALLSLGYVEWWLRHPLFEMLLQPPQVNDKEGKEEKGEGEKDDGDGDGRGGRAADLERRESGSELGRAADRALHHDEGLFAERERSRSRSTARQHRLQRRLPQYRQQLRLVHETLRVACHDGMRRLFDALVDVFIVTVQELLRCCRDHGALHASAHVKASALKMHSSAESNSERFTDVQQQGRYVRAGTTCAELLRLLTSLYADPPVALQPLLRENAVRTPSTPQSATTATASSPLRRNANASNTTADTTDGDAARAQGSSAQWKSSRALSSSSSPPPPPAQTPLRDQAAQRQLHYQLLYAVCRLCCELPLHWNSDNAQRTPHAATTSSAKAESEANWFASGVTSAAAPTSKPMSGGRMDHLRLFTAAVQLAAAIAVPLRSVQLPMKGDLLCVASRVAQQRWRMLQRGGVTEREYAVCVAHLNSLLSHAT